MSAVAEAFLALAATHRITIEPNSGRLVGQPYFVVVAVPLSAFNMVGTRGLGDTPEEAVQALLVELAKKRLGPSIADEFPHLTALVNAAKKSSVQ